jgi:hypothetical protein
VTCDHEGCNRGTHNGHALYRVSPKGQDFVGLCEWHLVGQPVTTEEPQHDRQETYP